MRIHRPSPTKDVCCTCRRGVSLVEVLVSSVLLATLAIGALTSVAAVSMSRSRMNDRLQAYQLAEQLLSEVMQARYADAQQPDNDLGRDSGETQRRSDFDDVDDYHRWNSSPPVDRGGTALSDYQNWTRQVQVEWVTPETLLVSTAETGLKRITVRVTDPAGETLELQGLRTRLGAVQQQSTRDASFVTWTGIELQIGQDSPVTASGTNLVNHASD